MTAARNTCRARLTEALASLDCLSADKHVGIGQELKSRLAKWKYDGAGGDPAGAAEQSARAALEWLCLAQKATRSGGFAQSYSLVHGWGLPYPETTGYTIPTLLAQDAHFPELQLRSRAERGGAWLAEVQLESGAICSKQWTPDNTTPSVFNTGMVLHGWVSLLEHWRASEASDAKSGATDQPQTLTRPSGTLSRMTGEGCGEAGPAERGAVATQQALTAPSGTLSRPTGEGWGEGNGRLWDAARKAVDWLIQQQEPNGSWVKAAFNGIPHTYYTMVDWALIRYSRLADDGPAREAARKNLAWTLRQQRPNGWLERCWFGVADPVTTHTLSYATQGLVESGRLLGEENYVEAAERATTPLLLSFEDRGKLVGTFDENWHPSARWECCAGNAQTSLVWQALGRMTGDRKWADAATKLNRRLLTYQKVNCRVPGINGAIPGSWPITGGYDSLAFPNHAAKFHIDALAGMTTDQGL